MFLFKHDLFGKPVSTFPDHALEAHHVGFRVAEIRWQAQITRMQIATAGGLS
jgi:ABC-type uncharacterized transport system permease subunit